MKKMISIINSSERSVNKGKLEKDENGYRKVLLGALNVFNSKGELYSAEQEVLDLFRADSTLMRRMKKKYLKGEAGHPKREPGMSANEFVNRNLAIYETHVSHHIKDVMLVEKEQPGQGGKKIVEVWGWVKPSGIFGDALEKAFENPDENVAFSIRCFSKKRLINGIWVRRIVQIITWDWVNEPGIGIANKFDSISNEDHGVDVEYVFDLEDLAHGNEIDECLNCTLESDEQREILEDTIKNYNNTSNEYDIINGW